MPPRNAPQNLLKPYLQVMENLRAAAKAPELRVDHEKALAKWEADKALPQTPATRRNRKPEDPVLGGKEEQHGRPLQRQDRATDSLPGSRGVVWYQGEANSTPEKSAYYDELLTLLVTDWRARWGSELPFAWVQLAGYDRLGEIAAIVREAMLKTLALPGTGMAVAATSATPKTSPQEQTGSRQASLTLGIGHRLSARTFQPLPDRCRQGTEIRGGEIVLRFTHTEGGLKAMGDALKGFRDRRRRRPMETGPSPDRRRR